MTPSLLPSNGTGVRVTRCARTHTFNRNFSKILPIYLIVPRDVSRMARIYLDANVFISIVKEEIGFSTRGLYIEATEFLIRTKNSGDTLVLSTLFFSEVEKITFMRPDDILEFFTQQEVKVEILPKIDVTIASQFIGLGIHNADAMHISIAIQTQCDYIVTFNLKDFQKQKRILVFGPTTSN